jgi:hypothetical protein
MTPAGSPVTYGRKERTASSVVSLKFVEEVQTMAPAEVELKSPCFPLFKGGFFSVSS